MSKEKINPEQFGLEKSEANELTIGLDVTLKERGLLINEFNSVSILEITKKNISTFKELRLRIVKNRTQGINKWHSNAKNYFLRGGQFVDAIKRKEIAVNEQMEDKLMDAEKHFENLEQERLNQLQSDRAEKLSKYVEDANERDLSGMDLDVWDAYLSTKRKEYEYRIAAEKKAEADRIAKEKAEKIERERIRKENDRLKKEAEAKEKQDKIDADKRAKIEQQRIKAQQEKEEKHRKEYEAKLELERQEKERIEKELKEKRDAEIKAQQEKEEKIQTELNKGDAAKMKDLISDLLILKTKYSFKSKTNIKKYNDVSLLIDKLINHIKE